jgi:flagellar biosynthesis/type III secretory pathway chaperone
VAPTDTIDQLLAAEIDGARLLLDVLRREQQALTGQDPHTVERAAEDKRLALAALQQLTSRRRALAANALSAARRSELEQLLIELRRQNEINGTLVQTRLQHTRRALAVLRGQSGQTDLYDPRGALASAPVAGRSIVSA